MKLQKTRLVLLGALALAGLSLPGCVVYPSGYAYNSYGYGGGYGYGGPAYYAPPVVGGVFIGGGWGGDRDGGGWGGGRHWR